MKKSVAFVLALFIFFNAFCDSPKFLLGDYYDAYLENQSVESKLQYEKLSKLIESGKPCERNLDLFEAYEEWTQILAGFEKYWSENCPLEFEISDLILEEIDFTTRQGKCSASVSFDFTRKYQEIFNVVKSGFDKAYKPYWSFVRSEWPEVPFNSFAGDVAIIEIRGEAKLASIFVENGTTKYFADFKIVDENNQCIFSKKNVALGGKISFENLEREVVKKIESGKCRVVPEKISLKYGPKESPKYKEIDLNKVDFINGASDYRGKTFVKENKNDKSESEVIDIIDDVVDTDLVDNSISNGKNKFAELSWDDEEIEYVYTTKSYEDIQKEIEKAEIEDTELESEKEVQKEKIRKIESRSQLNRLRIGAANFNLVKVDGGAFDVNGKKVDVKKFEIGQTEVTQQLFMIVTELAPSINKGKYLPVEKVSWFDAIYFCNQLSLKMGYTPCYSINGKTNPKDWNYKLGSGKVIKGTIKCDFNVNGFRLPTETEWEYAAREGKKNSKFVYSGSDNLDEVGWSEFNSHGTSHTVATKKENALGIFDMSGNVWEWCWDSYEKGKSEIFNAMRVIKGGAFYYDTYCSVSKREKFEPTFSCSYCGFRICRSAL